jgi:hypothetical protein
VAQVVAVASRVSASVAAGLFCVGLVRRVRQGGARSAGTAVAVYAAAVTGTAAAVAVAVGVADGLTEVALARGPGAADLAAIMDRGPAGAVDSPAGGSRAGAVALFLLWASVWISLAELSWRLVIIVVSIAAIPLVAGGLLVPGRSWRWGRAVRWAVVAIAIKPVLTLALVVEVAEVHRVVGGSGWSAALPA